MSIQSNQPTASVAIGARLQSEVAPSIAKSSRKADAALDTNARSGTDAAAIARQAAADLEKQIRAAGRNLQFQVDDGTGIVVVRVVDAVSGDVIRQIPNEEFLRLARNFRMHESDVNCILDACA